MWRNQLADVGLLYSLIDDLQTFWQLKALEWDKLHRKLQQLAQEEARTLTPNRTPTEKRLLDILEQNNDYQPLRDRLEEEISTALAIADFLGFTQITALKQLSFDTPLPPNDLLESAIAEAESLAPYAQKSSYWWYALLATLRRLEERYKRK